jgi:hypothetical protein
MTAAIGMWLVLSLAASAWIGARAWRYYLDDRRVVDAMLARRGLCRRLGEDDVAALERMSRIDAERADKLGIDYTGMGE